MFHIDTWQFIWGVLRPAWQFAILIWPVWIFILVLTAIRICLDWIGYQIKGWKIERKFKKGSQWRSDQELLHWLRGMSPTEFEEYIATLFRNLGFQVELTGGSHDHGIDLIAEKDGIKHYIQCKKFIIQSVGEGVLRDFYGAIADHFANGKGYFITTHNFTLEAEKFAEDKPIELIDGLKLVHYIHLSEKNTHI